MPGTFEPEESLPVTRSDSDRRPWPGGGLLDPLRLSPEVDRHPSLIFDDQPQAGLGLAMTVARPAARRCQCARDQPSSPAVPLDSEVRRRVRVRRRAGRPTSSA